MWVFRIGRPYVLQRFYRNVFWSCIHMFVFICFDPVLNSCKTGQRSCKLANCWINGCTAYGPTALHWLEKISLQQSAGMVQGNGSSSTVSSSMSTRAGLLYRQGGSDEAINVSQFQEPHLSAFPPNRRLWPGLPGQLGRHPLRPTHDGQLGVWQKPRRHRHTDEEHWLHRAGPSPPEALVLLTLPPGTDRPAHPLPLRVLSEVPQEPQVSAEAPGEMRSLARLVVFEINELEYFTLGAYFSVAIVGTIASSAPVPRCCLLACPQNSSTHPSNTITWDSTNVYSSYLSTRPSVTFATHQGMRFTGRAPFLSLRLTAGRIR